MSVCIIATLSGEYGESAGRYSMERSARFIWLLLVVNVVILLTALIMAALCCRRAGSGYVSAGGPYTYIGLPGSTLSTYTL